MEDHRWKAIAMYRTKSGPLDIEYTFEELEDLHDLIERGPDWNTLLSITITLARISAPDLTLEAAAG